MHRVETCSRLRGLRPILERWCKINDQISRDWKSVGDAPWWYNERASVSVFAGAVWRSGETAFEEFSEQKRSKRLLKAGRFDLWFSAGAREYVGEAKWCWVPFTSSKGPTGRVGAAMEQAKADARRIPPDGSTRRLAIVFGCPYIRPLRPAKLQARIDWLIAESHRVDHDALAWVFPRLKTCPEWTDRWLAPGAIVWIKEVRR